MCATVSGQVRALAVHPATTGERTPIIRQRVVEASPAAAAATPVIDVRWNGGNRRIRSSTRTGDRPNTILS